MFSYFLNSISKWYLWNDELKCYKTIWNFVLFLFFVQLHVPYLNLEFSVVQFFSPQVWFCEFFLWLQCQDVLRSKSNKHFLLTSDYIVVYTFIVSFCSEYKSKFNSVFHSNFKHLKVIFDEYASTINWLF